MRSIKWLALLILWSSCQKELSDPGANPPAQTCLVDRITQINSSGDTIGYVSAEFDSDMKGLRVQDFDVVGNKFIYDVPLQWHNDTVYTDGGTDNYYVTDPANNSRVKKYVSINGGLGAPLPDDLFFLYSYDANGYLSNKSYTTGALEIARFVYTWSSGDLVKITAEYFGVTIYEAIYTYYTDQPVKDFLPLHIDFYDYGLDMALNFGKKSAHAVKTINVTGEDENGNPISANVAFSDYVVDASNGHVQSYKVSGSGLSAFGVYDGTNKISYHCK